MPRIESLYAFVTEDAGPDDEGIVAMQLGKQWVPMVGADMERVESLKPVAIRLSNVLGKRIKILRFDVRSEIGVIEPERR